VHDAKWGNTCRSLTVKFTEPAQLDQRRGIDRILAEQYVVIDSEELHATGDRATYQQASDVVELTGHPAWRLRQYEGRAEELTVNRKTREFHAARSVEMTLPQDSIGRRGFLLPENPAQSNPASIQDQPVRVRAEDFEFQPDLANTNLNLAVFCGQVQVQSGKGNLSCEIMSIKSSAPDNRTQSAVAQGGVVMEQGDKRVTGDEAVYTAATETVEVTGRPAWKMGPREGVAEALKFDLTNGVYRATRNVRMRLPAGSFGSSTWLLPETRDGVSASAPATASVRATQSPQGPIEVSCDEFEFQAAVPDVKTDTATYRGNVLVKDPERMQVSGERLTAKMLPGTNQVETVVVEQKVDIAIEEPGGERHAHGDKAVYTAADGQVMLTSDARVEIRFVEPRIDGRATGAKAVYASAKDTLELTGDPVVTLPYGQAWGDVVILDRSNTVLSATGNWRLKLDPELLNKAAKPALKPQSSGKTGSLHED